MTREELKAHCEKQIKNCEMWAISRGEKPSGKIYEEHKLILELLEADVAPVIHAEWAHQHDDYFDWWECTNCGYGGEGEMQFVENTDVRTNYCPNCGAKMDGEG